MNQAFFIWVHAYEDILIDTHCHWVGGSPINLEVYGMASWQPTKGIIFLRNPSDQPLEYGLDLNQVFELPENHQGTFILKSRWAEDSSLMTLILDSKVMYTITLKPFEVLVLETY